MDNWINCSERLPDKGKRFIVTDGENVFEAYRRWSDGEWNGWHCLGNEFFDEPTHWQPLPPPPKQVVHTPEETNAWDQEMDN